jgi:spore maturation protein CgeB
MKIIYSFNKKGFEAEYWTREIAAASTPVCEFIPFNHDPYLETNLYTRAQLLDNLYYQEHPGLKRMYEDILQKIHETGADVLLVDNCPPYHPDFLRKLYIYKVLRTGDGPITAYDRDFAYLHAYDHILYHSPAYSRDMGMAEKLCYCGAKRADLWTFGLFDAMHNGSLSEDELMAKDRPIDVIYIGMPHLGKMPVFAKIQKHLGSKLKMIGFPFKHSFYYNLKYGFPGFNQRPIRTCGEYVSNYQSTKIGINIHNRGKYTTGNYRMFELPANGVMQISDGDEYLDTYFTVGKEIESYASIDELIDKIDYYLTHDVEREKIARAGYRRVKQEYTIGALLQKAGSLIYTGMKT